ncbi:hypothetical protein BKH46_03635 [Helicobacter sp. 12S02634-8]|nr:hypothetical protein BKH46_03635 [Helicobacter sp. 12S02634-8]
MFFKHTLQGILLFILAAMALRADELASQKREVYMLKGQLYEQEQALKLADIAKKKNGIFMGVILGSMTFNTAYYAQVHPLVYGLRVGYQKYLKDYIGGLRFYGEYLRADTTKMTYQLGSANLDVIADVPLDNNNRYALGGYAGVGMGWVGYGMNTFGLKPDVSHLGIVFNLGLALTLNIKHRIELGIKIPPLVSQAKGLYSFATTNAYMVSYNLLF